MRLFIGVALEPQLKEQLNKIAQRLKEQALKGKFIFKDNYHLTVAFLGDVEPDKLNLLADTIKSTRGTPFSFTIEGLGTFKRNGGDIYWLGIKAGQALFTYQVALTANLLKAGFTVEDKPYRPHLTLGRQVAVPSGFKKEEIMLPQDLTVNTAKITLFESVRIDSKLTYRELDDFTLAE